VVAMIEIVHHQALVANQFCLMAEQLTEIAPVSSGALTSVGARGTAEQLGRMTRLAAEQLRGAASAFSERDAAVAAQLEARDDALDRLNREIFVAAQSLEVRPERRELALRHVLIARSLERIGDNAVSIAWQAAFIVTADFPGRTAASAR
jgi:phosphate uptake regulator